MQQGEDTDSQAPQRGLIKWLALCAVLPASQLPSPLLITAINLTGKMRV